jgi:hypothetical protein
VTNWNRLGIGGGNLMIVVPKQLQQMSISFIRLIKTCNFSDNILKRIQFIFLASFNFCSILKHMTLQAAIRTIDEYVDKVRPLFKRKVSKDWDTVKVEIHDDNAQFICEQWESGQPITECLSIPLDEIDESIEILQTLDCVKSEIW